MNVQPIKAKSEIILGADTPFSISHCDSCTKLGVDRQRKTKTPHEYEAVLFFKSPAGGYELVPLVELVRGERFPSRLYVETNTNSTAPTITASRNFEFRCGAAR